MVAKFAALQKKYTFSLLYNYLRNYKDNKCMIAFLLIFKAEKHNWHFNHLVEAN